MFFQQDIFGLVLRQIRDFGDDEQLLDQSESFLLSFVHDVLLCSSSEDPLQEKNSHFSFDVILGRTRLALQFCL